MTETINDITITRLRGASISLDFTPKGPAFTYLIGLTAYTPAGAYHAPIAVPITFTGSATFYDEGHWASEWRWDMGDGTTHYGQVPTHVYKANPHTLVSLRVTDNKGHQYSTGQILYLADYPATFTTPGINVTEI